MDDLFVEYSNIIPNEKSAITYLEKVRWGNEIECPLCGGKKYYQFSSRSNKRVNVYTCGSDGCRRNFTITTDSLIQYTPLPISFWTKSVWLKLFGEVVTVEKIKTFIGVKEDLTADRILFKTNIVCKDAIGNTKFEKFRNALKNIFILKDEYKHYESIAPLCNPFNIKFDPGTINTTEGYLSVVKYITKKKNLFRWIHIKSFAAPQEIASELYIYLDEHERVIDNYDHWVRKCVWRVIQKMWIEYCDGNVRIREKQRVHLKRLHQYHKKRGRRILAKWYIANLKSKIEKISEAEAYKRTEDHAQIKERIIARRKRLSKTPIIADEYFEAAS